MDLEKRQPSLRVTTGADPPLHNYIRAKAHRSAEQVGDRKFRHTVSLQDHARSCWPEGSERGTPPSVPRWFEPLRACDKAA